MVEEINVIIDEWDPIGLFPFAPKDEYLDESECEEVAEKIVKSI